MGITVHEQTDKIILEINEGHLDQLKKAQERWNFVDLQGFIGYALGIVCVHEGDAIEILVNDKLKKVYPQAHLLKDKEDIKKIYDELNRHLKELMNNFNGKPNIEVSESNEDNVVSYDEYRSKMKNE